MDLSVYDHADKVVDLSLVLRRRLVLRLVHVQELSHLVNLEVLMT